MWSSAAPEPSLNRQEARNHRSVERLLLLLTNVTPNEMCEPEDFCMSVAQRADPAAARVCSGCSGTDVTLLLHRLASPFQTFE